MSVGRSVWLVLLLLGVSAPAAAQTSSSPPDQAGMSMPAGQTMTMPTNPLGIDQTRDGSGTSWLPDASPMEGPMKHSGGWMLMVHGRAFLQFIDSTGDRGDHEIGSVNWFMGMAQRPVRGGQLLFRGMLSLEPLTVGKCGYPDVLQSGEVCNGAQLHDQQHPHDLFMELAATYRHAINGAVALEIYGGPVGEPALGPTAFPHRLSAMGGPAAPISHHWLDSSHVSFGVVTGGIYGRQWKAETSVFNGREPDDNRYDFDFGRLDSYSGRFWWLPTPAWAIQVSAGHLAQGEASPSGTREDVDRVTASATYHRLVNGRLWATTVAWGQNQEAGHRSDALLVETSAEVSRSHSVFARGELVGKTPTDLALPLATPDSFAVSKVELGYTRWLGAGLGARAGLGASVGLSVVPSTLASFYGGRVGEEFSIFLAVRPR